VILLTHCDLTYLWPYLLTVILLTYGPYLLTVTLLTYGPTYLLTQHLIAYSRAYFFAYLLTY
jgi:hypothetical protein